MQGTISAWGKRAATIKIENGQQFYAPYAELSLMVICDLLKDNTPLEVTFIVDETRESGQTFTIISGQINSLPRYYALCVELKNIIIL